MKKDYQTHVFTSTYTADVSGVCSALYELGGMSVLHDPSGCNSTYSTHDEPRWFDTDSLMYVSGLDEITAVLGDDRVLIEDVKAAAEVYLPAIVKADVTVVLGVEVISEVDTSWGEVIGYSVKYVNDFRNVLIVVVG